MLITLIILGCKSNPENEIVEIKPFAPATYFGVIPCADCEGIEMQINLLDDFTYMLKQVYLDKEEKGHITLGKWGFVDSTQILTLKNIDRSPKKYVLTSSEKMEMLNIHGKRIESDLNYTLTKKENLEPITEAFPMKGMFTYMADAAMFVECSSHKKYPVAMEKDFISLEQEYLSNIEEPGKAMLVTLKGSLVPRTKMDGEGEILSLVVEKFDKVWPRMDCQSSLSTATLINTYWKLVEIDGKPIKVPSKVRELHFILRADGKTVKGFGGCNQFGGSYKVEEDKIKFGPIAGTLKFCSEIMDIETSFIKVFSEANNYKIFGEKLELYKDTEIIAKFESVYF